ncbi:MAG: polysaccharide biosynthesis/export family protein [Longimicrobiaceae bacterium]
MKATGLFSLWTLALLLLAPAVAAAQQPAVGSGNVAVRPGDEIKLEVFGVQELSVERVVDRDGEIQLPFLGGVQVGGLSPEEIRERVTNRYSSLYATPLVNVEVKVGVNVTGSVTRPDRYRLDPTSTVLDAIAQAGGVSDRGNPSSVELRREGQIHSLNLEAGPGSEPMLTEPVRSGDWIHVPEKFLTPERVTFFLSLASLAVTSIFYFAVYRQD